MGGLGEIVEGDLEYTYHAEHQAMYRIRASLYYAPETSITLSVNYSEI